MDIKSRVRMENKNYDGLIIETIIHLKKKIMLFLRKLALLCYSL